MRSKKLLFIVAVLFLSLRIYVQAQEASQKKFFILAESGFMLVKSEDINGESGYGSYVPFRLGVLYQAIPQFDIYFAVGAGVNLSGNPWKTFFMPTLGFTLHFGPALFGIGVSYNSQLKETGDKTSFYHPFFFGVQVFRRSKMQGAVFVEGQIPMRYRIGEGGGWSRWHKFSLGFRFLF